MGQYHHIVFVMGQDNPKMVEGYVDGQKVFDTSCSKIPDGLTSYIVNVGALFYGVMDELAIWTRELSDDEVQSIYQNQLPVTGN